MAEIESYKKNSKFLVCVDSDGCAMDTMDEKHEKAFCPRLIDVYALQSENDFITAYWMKINLHSATRGINRFKGLLMTLQMLTKEKAMVFEGLDEFADWMNNTKALSNAALSQAIEAGKNGVCMQKALQWSLAVNDTVKKMAGSDRPYDGVREALAQIHLSADVAVVSSANGSAVTDEWTRHGLAQSTNLLMGQEYGAKAHQIATLLGYDYDKNCVMMVGDALGDRDAAFANGVHFFPILTGQETASWKQLVEQALPRLENGTFTPAYQKELTDAMEAILN